MNMRSERSSSLPDLQAKILSDYSEKSCIARPLQKGALRGIDLVWIAPLAAAVWLSFVLCDFLDLWPARSAD